MEKRFEQAVKLWRDNVKSDIDFALLLPQNDEHRNALFRTVFNSKLGDRCGIIFEGEQAIELLTLYSLYAFTDKLIIGSFDLPQGRKLFNLLDSGIATAEELINDVILGAM
jgi:hypothetical protein